MWRVALVLLVGCNQIFDLRETQTRPPDAAPIDAPFACPGLGQPPPSFSPLLHQMYTRRCNNYSFSAVANRAAAVCDQNTINVGPIDGELAPAVGVTSPTISTYLLEPRLSADGDRIYVEGTDYSAMTTRLMVFGRDPDNTWRALPDVSIATGYTEFPSFIGITAPPRAHLLMIQNYKLREYISDDNSGWSPPILYTDNELGTVPYGAASTEDGLRLIIHGVLLMPPNGTAMFYTDRPDLDSRFRPVTRIDTLPDDLQDPFMSPDCARVYFSGFGSILYIQQR